jgi:2-dehydropantoate 2-reductase
MKILVYGAGPLGSLFATRLHKTGHDVSLLARGQRLADLRRHGVVLEYVVTGRIEATRVKVVEALNPDDDYDLIMVVMRKDQTRDILPMLAANRHAHTVLFLQNNAAGFGAYIKALSSDRVMAGFPTAGGERRGHVMRVMPLDWVAMPVGETDGRITERTRAVARLLRSTGKRVEIRRDMEAWLVTHVADIAVFGGLFAAVLDPARYGRTRDAMLLGVRARTEALRAQQAAGVPV